MSETFVITVSGSCAGVGKTHLIEMLIPCLKNCAAVKARAQESMEHSVVVEDDPDESPGTDTGRFLSAGARRAFLIDGTPGEARRVVEKIVADGEFDVVIVESNELARQLDGDLAFFVKGDGEAKPGADVCEELADVIVQGLSAQRREQ